MENLTEQMAKDFLKSKGYYVEYLFHRNMVRNKFNVTIEESEEILADAVEQSELWQFMDNVIELLCEANHFKPYEELTEFDVLEMSKEKLIDFLYWNDRNGVWDDEEEFPPLTLDECKEFAIRYILGEETQSEEFGYPTENQHFLKLTLEKLNK